MKKIKKILSYVVFWLIQCTWGAIMTTIGAIAALILIIAGYKPKTLGPTVYFEVGENWGGVELGGFFLCSKNSPLDTKYHECGHGLQNLIWGPLMPLVVCIPSAARYWLFMFNNQLKRALFIVILMVASVLLCTLGAWIFATIGGLKLIVILFEVLRIYFLLLVIWLHKVELPKFTETSMPSYYAMWFERQATDWGTKLYAKKED